MCGQPRANSAYCGRRKTADVAPAAAEVCAAEMPTAMTAATKMRAAVPTAMATTVTAAVATTMTTAALRNGISGGRQRGRQNNHGNPDTEF